MRRVHMKSRRISRESATMVRLQAPACRSTVTRVGVNNGCHARGRFSICDHAEVTREVAKCPVQRGSDGL
jgi:hypothetical protein